MYPHVSLSGAFCSNGDRHALKALLHSIMGRYGWACGSHLKAIRNYDRAFWLDAFLDQ